MVQLNQLESPLKVNNRVKVIVTRVTANTIGIVRKKVPILEKHRHCQNENGTCGHQKRQLCNRQMGSS